MHYISKKSKDLLTYEYNDDEVTIIGITKKKKRKKFIFQGLIESFDKPFTNEYIGISDDVPARIGDISDALEILKNKIINELKYKDDFVEISRIIYTTVNEYFGGTKKRQERFSYYEDSHWVKGTDEIEECDNKISNLKGTGAAECVEWAALAHNLLHSLGIKSVYKCTKIVFNGKEDIHAFNLVEFKGRFYIFDTTVPNLIKGQINPIIAEISKEEFDIMCIPHRADATISINTVHKNPFNNENIEITYNYGENRIIRTVPSFGSQKRTK